MCESHNLVIRPFEETDQDDVISLWHECNLVVPWNDPAEDIAMKLKVQREFFIVGILDGNIAASAMAGYDGHRGYVNYLAVSPAHRKKGFGRMLMEYIENEFRKIGCPKINVEIRTGNLQVTAFYERIGYKDNNIVGMGKRLAPPE